MSLMSHIRMPTSQETGRGLNRHGRLLETLKQALLTAIPANTIASLVHNNLQRAENEIRSACNVVFEGETWEQVSASEKEKLVEELIHGIIGLGPLEDLLADGDITEIMVNGIESLFYEKQGRLFQAENVFTEDDQVRALIDRILGPLGRRIDELSPMVDARLPQGHRVNAIIPPLSLNGPVLTIRKFGECVLSIDRLVQEGAVEKGVACLLEWAVVSRKNIAVTGGTGSGKTTVLNALSCIIPQSERIITIEDSAELRFHEHPHVVSLESRPQNAEGKGKITICDLVINALRMRPDRIVVGECRGGEALDMLQAMNTGHDGSLTTLHANSPTDSIMRLATLVRYSADLPIDVIESQIASAIDLVVHTVRSVTGQRYISEIASYSYSRETRRCTSVTYYKRNAGHRGGEWKGHPLWVDALSGQDIVTGEEVERWKQELHMSY